MPKHDSRRICHSSSPATRRTDLAVRYQTTTPLFSPVLPPSLSMCPPRPCLTRPISSPSWASLCVPSFSFCLLSLFFGLLGPALGLLRLGWQDALMNRVPSCDRTGQVKAWVEDRTWTCPFLHPCTDDLLVLFRVGSPLLRMPSRASFWTRGAKRVALMWLSLSHQSRGEARVCVIDVPDISLCPRRPPKYPRVFPTLPVFLSSSSTLHSRFLVSFHPGGSCRFRGHAHFRFDNDSNSIHSHEQELAIHLSIIQPVLRHPNKKDLGLDDTVLFFSNPTHPK